MTTPDVVGAGRPTLPLILIRGFGGLGVSDEKRIAYQGFNDGTVYPRSGARTTSTRGSSSGC
jgi:hypothetical protein